MLGGREGGHYAYIVRDAVTPIIKLWSPPEQRCIAEKLGSGQLAINSASAVGYGMQRLS